MNNRLKKKSRLPFLALAVLCIAVILVGSLWVALKRGINIEKVIVSSVEVEQLTIRLDKRLTVSVDQIKVLDRPQTGTPASPEALLARFNAWSHLFSEIRVKRILWQSHVYTLQFKNKLFTVSGDNFQLSSTISYEKGEVQLDLSHLEVKPYPFILSGRGAYDRGNKSFNFNGTFNGLDIIGHINLAHSQDRLVAEINTEHFSDLAGILANFHVSPKITSWIADNVSTRDYRIEQLKLETKIEDGKLDIQPTSISGKAVTNDAAIRFHPSLPPVQSKRIKISYQNDQLSFDLEEPVYRSKNLDGSKVKIAPMTGKNPQLAINVHTDTPLDSEIHYLLEKYNIHIPFTQNSGTTLVDLHLIFDLPEFTLHTEGQFITGEGKWTLGDIDFETSEAIIQLKDSLVTIANANVNYQEKIQASFSGAVDTASKKASLTSDIDKFNIQNGRLNINYTDPENMRFDGSINTSILPLSSDGEPITFFNFHGTKAADELIVDINEGKMSLSLSDKLIMNLHDYQVTVNIDEIGEKKGPRAPVLLPFYASGPSIIIKSKMFSVPTKNFRGEINGTNIRFTADQDQGKILFESNDGNISLEAKEIDAVIAQNFFPHTDLEGGIFSLSLTGEGYKNYEAFVEFNNVLIKRAKVFNNVLAFINSVPSLATFSSPGFDSQGYQVSKGIASFSISNDLLTFHQIRTDGTTINFDAEGWINLENKTLELRLELITLKDYSKIISKIPLLGHAVLGDDGSISTSLDITGSLDEPEINTNLTREIGMLPINMVQRTIKRPRRIFGKSKDSVSQQPATEK